MEIQDNKNGIAEDAVSVVIANANIYIPFAELVDITQEIARLEKEEKRLESELARVNSNRPAFPGSPFSLDAIFTSRS